MTATITTIFDARIANFIQQNNSKLQLKDIISHGRVHVFALARALGYTLTWAPWPEKGALIDHTIIINDQAIKTRQRFIVAHELGCAAHAQLRYNRQTSIITFANRFAAALLMPKSLVDQTLSKAIDRYQFNAYRLTNDQVTVIKNFTARRLNVSTGALRYRIEDLGLISSVSKEPAH